MAVARAIAEALDLNPRMSALDVGSGTGRLSILLADLVGSAVVTDPSAGIQGRTSSSNSSAARNSEAVRGRSLASTAIAQSIASSSLAG